MISPSIEKFDQRAARMPFSLQFPLGKGRWLNKVAQPAVSAKDLHFKVQNPPTAQVCLRVLHVTWPREMTIQHAVWGMTPLRNRTFYCLFINWEVFVCLFFITPTAFCSSSWHLRTTSYIAQLFVNKCFTFPVATTAVWS